MIVSQLAVVELEVVESVSLGWGRRSLGGPPEAGAGFLEPRPRRLQERPAWLGQIWMEIQGGWPVSFYLYSVLLSLARLELVALKETELHNLWYFSCQVW